MRHILARLAPIGLVVPLVAGATLLAQQTAVPGPITSQELVDGLKADGVLPWYAERPRRGIAERR